MTNRTTAELLAELREKLELLTQFGQQLGGGPVGHYVSCSA